MAAHRNAAPLQLRDHAWHTRACGRAARGAEAFGMCVVPSATVFGFAAAHPSEDPQPRAVRQILESGLLPKFQNRVFV